ncbi:MAG TPA: hypothetical protein VFI46_17345, partial [Jiangellaceae bacterium]|nr:hypothetical protein [Jiangellaceae bacterium]
PPGSQRRLTQHEYVTAIPCQTTKAVYVRDEDVELWARAERYARARRMPVSGLVMAALEAYLDEADPER